MDGVGGVGGTDAADAGTDSTLSSSRVTANDVASAKLTSSSSGDVGGDGGIGT